MCGGRQPRPRLLRSRRRVAAGASRTSPRLPTPLGLVGPANVRPTTKKIVALPPPRGERPARRATPHDALPWEREVPQRRPTCARQPPCLLASSMEGAAAADGLGGGAQSAGSGRISPTTGRFFPILSTLNFPTVDKPSGEGPRPRAGPAVGHLRARRDVHGEFLDYGSCTSICRATPGVRANRLGSAELADELSQSFT
jgi:hypothetical protein